jgi:hypothetical protein
MAIFDRLWRRQSTDDGLYLLGHVTFNIYPSVFDRESDARENRILNRLIPTDRSDQLSDPSGELSRLGEKLQATLEERLEGKSVAEVRLGVRRGTIVLEAAFFLGVYAAVKDYKTLRDSVQQLNSDVKNFLGVADWRVVADVHTPGPVGRQISNVGVGMDLASRFAFPYLIITNLVLLVLFVVLAWIVVMANVPAAAS